MHVCDKQLGAKVALTCLSTMAPRKWHLGSTVCLDEAMNEPLRFMGLVPAGQKGVPMESYKLVSVVLGYNIIDILVYRDSYVKLQSKEQLTASDAVAAITAAMIAANVAIKACDAHTSLVRVLLDSSLAMSYFLDSPACKTAYVSSHNAAGHASALLAMAMSTEWSRGKPVEATTNYHVHVAEKITGEFVSALIHRREADIKAVRATQELYMGTPDSESWRWANSLGLHLVK